MRMPRIFSIFEGGCISWHGLPARVEGGSLEGDRWYMETPSLNPEAFACDSRKCLRLRRCFFHTRPASSFSASPSTGWKPVPRVGITMVALVFICASAVCFGDDVLGGRFAWRCGPPLVEPVERPQDPCYSVKDPSIVFFKDRWHLFCTIRSRVRTHQIEYLTFPDWPEAKSAEHHVMKLSNGYFCAPQVFYFTPHRKWYMILQIMDPNAPAFASAGVEHDG